MLISIIDSRKQRSVGELSSGCSGSGNERIAGVEAGERVTVIVGEGMGQLSYRSQ